jgi:hypothetical protein
MPNLTLEAYQQAERAVAQEERRRGFTIHAVITTIVCVGLIALNVFVASEFPWAIFPVVGMSIGLYMHWHFGVVNAEATVRQHQQSIEHKAA